MLPKRLLAAAALSSRPTLRSATLRATPLRQEALSDTSSEDSPTRRAEFARWLNDDEARDDDDHVARLGGEWYDERRGELLRRDEISKGLLNDHLHGATGAYHVDSQLRYVIVRFIRDGLTRRAFVVDDYPYEADDEESKEEAEFRVRLAYGPRVIVTRRSRNGSTQVQERQAARAASRAPHRARGE